MADSLWMKLRKVPWEKFPPHPGTDKKVPKILENLASRKEPRAMKASHELWSALCAGSISPAAEASLPFLIDILKISSPAVQSEILDMLLKFAESGSKELILPLQRATSIFKKLSQSNDEIVSERSAKLLTSLSS